MNGGGVLCLASGPCWSLGWPDIRPAASEGALLQMARGRTVSLQLTRSLPPASSPLTDPSLLLCMLLPSPAPPPPTPSFSIAPIPISVLSLHLGPRGDKSRFYCGRIPLPLQGLTAPRVLRRCSEPPSAPSFPPSVPPSIFPSLPPSGPDYGDSGGPAGGGGEEG